MRVATNPRTASASTGEGETEENARGAATAPSITFRTRAIRQPRGGRTAPKQEQSASLFRLMTTTEEKATSRQIAAMDAPSVPGTRKRPAATLSSAAGTRKAAVATTVTGKCQLLRRDLNS